MVNFRPKTVKLTVPNVKKNILKRYRNCPNDTKTVPNGPNDQATETVSLRCHNGKRRWTNCVERLKRTLEVGRTVDRRMLDIHRMLVGLILDGMARVSSRDGTKTQQKMNDSLYIKV